MMGLVESYGTTCLLSDIKGVHYVSAGEGRADHYLLRRHSGEESLKLFGHDYAAFEARPVQMLPAEPGTQLITVFGGLGASEEPFADKAPILAWALCMDGQIRPFTPTGVVRGYSSASVGDWYPEYVELADGTIFEFGHEAEPGASDCLEAVLARELRRQRGYEAARERQAVAQADAA